MPQFQPNDFIRWSSADEEGKFSHIGEVVSCNADTVVFQGEGYEFTVPLDDGKFTKARRPKDWTAELPPPPPIVHTPVPEKQRRPAKAGSKKELAQTIFKAESDRTSIVQRFQSELNMSKAGAATYYSNFKSGRWG